MGRGGGLSRATIMKRDCQERLRCLTFPDDVIIATGTAEELPSLGPDIGSGGGWTFIVLTVDRVLFAKWDSPERPHHEIRLDDVIHWASGRQYNCYVLVLTHPPSGGRGSLLARGALRFGRRRRGGSVKADVHRTQTIFRFSRPGTEVAKAIRGALEDRQVPHTALSFEERPRRDRTRGSRAVLTPKRR